VREYRQVEREVRLEGQKEERRRKDSRGGRKNTGVKERGATSE
jgi:hypothetical protein